MRRHKVRVVSGRMFISNSELNRNNRNVDVIDLKLDQDFSGLMVYCVLFSGDDAIVCKYTGDPITLPDEVYSRGEVIPLSIWGVADDGSRIVVSNNSAFHIV